MKYIRRSLAVLLVGCVAVATSVKGEIDFGKNRDYYQKLCATRSGYNANKTVCTKYQDYLNNLTKNSNNNIADYKKELASTKDDITKTSAIISKIQDMIKGKEQRIALNEANIKETKTEINDLENDLLERFALMQSFENDNFTIDFLMSSNSLDDFFTKVVGVNALNKANEEVVGDLRDQEKKLATYQKQLIDDQKQLKESKVVYEDNLKAFNEKEAGMMEKIAAEQKKQTTINSQLTNLNVKDLEDKLNNSQPSPKPDNGAAKEKPQGNTNNNSTSNSGNKNTNNNSTSNNSASNSNNNKQSTTSKGLEIPIYHATVTATAWYYYGGGWHPGIDLANNTGTVVHAPGNGVVLYTAITNSGYGRYVVAAFQDGKDTYTMIFGHMSQVSVSQGEVISKGQQLGLMGSTGYSTGPHTHVEIFKHTNKSLSQVVSQYKSSYDYYFGLGYNSIGNCNTICRLAPQNYWGLSYMQRY